MKRSVNLPHHKMLEPLAAPFEVDAKIIHNCDIISEVLRCREAGEPTAFSALWEIDPPTP